VEGPLDPKVVFPSRNQIIGVRDSNFIFGSVGNGRARLTINGAPVSVAPNGAFLAYLPVPPPAAPRYEVVAYLGAATDTGVRVTDVWESAEQFDAFVRDRLMPGIKELGIPGEPRVEIHPLRELLAPGLTRA
jgi:hypothetical protein